MIGIRRTATALFLLTVAVYLAAWPNEFVRLDDGLYLFDNPVVRQGLSADGVAYAFTTFTTGNWIPLTWLSLEGDVSLFGVSPVGTHAVNVLFHAANAVLLYLLLLWATQANSPSALTAAMFAVHPLHVESVAWASERKDVLSTFWLLVALLAYRRYVLRPTLGRWGVVTLAFLCGLLSKSMLVTLPVLLCLLDWWPLRRFELDRSRHASRTLIVEKLPWLAMSLAIGLVTIAAQRSIGNTRMLPEVSLPLRIATAIDNYGWYLWKTTWPTSLCALYYHPQTFPPWGRLAASLLACGSLSLFSVLFGRRFPAFFVGWWWFVISLLPVIGLVQVGEQSHADRYAYVPHLGLLTGLAFTLHDWLAQRVRVQWLPRYLAALVLIAWGALTVAQTTHWRTTEDLWQRVVAVDPDNWVAGWTLSSIRIEQGRLDEAEELANRAIEKRPRESTIYGNLGAIWLKRGSPEQALASYRRGVEADPANAEGWYNLARFQLSQGDIQNGVASLAKCVEVNPQNPRWHNELGMVQAARGDTRAALDHFLDAVNADPRFSMAHYNAALLLFQADRDDVAKQHLLEAVRLTPWQPAFQAEAGRLMEFDGDLTAARDHYRAALRYDPSNAIAREGMERLASGRPISRR